MKKSGNRNHAGRTAAFRWAVLLVALPPLLAAFPTPADALGPTGCESILVNGSFETTPQPVLGGSRSFSDIGGQDVPGWVLEVGGFIEIQRNLRGAAADGNQWLELAASQSAKISQSVSTFPGALYELRFAYSARPGFRTDNKFRVTWGGAQKEIETAAVGTTTWQYASLTAKAPADGGGKITFQDLSGGTAAAAMLIDDVTLCRVPGLATKCCCGGNEVFAFTEFPHLSWALAQNGNLLRLWWDQVNMQEELAYERFNQPLVSGSLRRDPFGDGVLALSDRGGIVRAVEENGKWSIEHVLPRRLSDLGWVRPCALITTFGEKFKGIYAVTEKRMVRIWQDVPGGPWQHKAVPVGGAHRAAQIVPTSLHETLDGRIAGVLDDGERWFVWFEDDDPDKMRFDFNSGDVIAVPPVADCEE